MNHIRYHIVQNFMQSSKNTVKDESYMLPYSSEFFLSGRRQRRNCGGPGSLDCTNSSIFSTLTRGGDRLLRKSSSKTSKGCSIVCQKQIKSVVRMFIMLPSEHLNEHLQFLSFDRTL